jgi:hypothetical protein
MNTNFSNVDKVVNSEPTSDTLVEAEKTTTFVEDGAKVVGSFGNTMTYSNYGGTFTGVTDFLAKPYILSSGSWSTADVRNTPIFGLTLTNAAFPAVWSNKLAGFKLMRGVMNFKLTINANPFQQGKLMMAWKPPGLPAVRDKTTTASMVMFSQLPNLEIDCRDGVALFSVPYISPQSYYVNTGPGAGSTLPLGSIEIRVLAPLQVGAGGSTSINYSLYWWFSELELVAPIVPQSRTGRIKAKTVKFSEEAKPKISDGLNGLATLATVAEGVPLLAPLAGPVAWAARVGSKIASAFGWSKPTLDSNTQPVMKNVNRTMANADGNDSLPYLGLNNDSRLQIRDDLSVYPEDEMSMRFLLSRWSFVTAFIWSASDGPTTRVYSANVGPNTLYDAGTTIINGVTANWRVGPPVWYLAQFFQFFRGGIEVCFKIVKTDFHTGRVQISYTPNPTNSVTLPNTTTTGVYALREIVDLRTSSEIHLTLPYLSSTIWQNLKDGYDMLGALSVDVINELRAPETCAQSVVVLVYYRAASDFEYAAPCLPNYNTYQPPLLIQSGVEEVVMQSGKEEAISETIGDTILPNYNTQFTELSQGESITSIKQLLNRYAQQRFTALPSVTNGESIDFWPWAGGYYSQNPVTGVAEATSFGGDAYSNLCWLYCYFRGPARVMVRTAFADTGGIGSRNAITTTLVTANRPTTTILANGTPSFGAGGTSNIWFTTIEGFTGIHVMDANTGLTGGVVPYYCQTPMSIVPVTPISTGYRPNTNDSPKSSINFTSLQAFTNFDLYRSFSDDFQFTYFIGCPPVLQAAPA